MKIAADQVKNGSDPAILRGDPITGDRYTCPDFAAREWECLWKKIWHVAGRENELLESGDFIVHNFMRESVVVVKQDDGRLKAFYNACGHRGLRLVNESSSMTDGFHCPYHGWLWGIDGSLKNVQNPEDFPENPCGKLKLVQLRCKTWGGFVWYTMDDHAPDLLDYLSPIPELCENYPLETLVRVF